MSTPRGMRPPRRRNFCGDFKKAMISVSSSLASSTSGHVSEGDRRFLLIDPPGAVLPQREQTTVSSLHAPHQKDPHPDDADQRQPLQKQR